MLYSISICLQIFTRVNFSCQISIPVNFKPVHKILVLLAAKTRDQPAYSHKPYRAFIVRAHTKQRRLCNFKVDKGATVRNRYNQVPHLTEYTNGKVTNSQIDTINEKQEVSPFPAGDSQLMFSYRTYF